MSDTHAAAHLDGWREAIAYLNQLGREHAERAKGEGRRANVREMGEARIKAVRMYFAADELQREIERRERAAKESQS